VFNADIRYFALFLFFCCTLLPPQIHFILVTNYGPICTGHRRDAMDSPHRARRFLHRKKTCPAGGTPMKHKRTLLVLEELECRDLLSAGVLPTQPLLDLARDVSLHAAEEITAWRHATDAVTGILLTAIRNQPAARFSSLNPTWFTPAEIQKAYGFSAVPGLASNYNNTAGKGQTIAIVDVYDDPNILSDTNTFSRQFGLPQFNQTGNANSPTFVKLNENDQDITNEPSGIPHPQLNSAWTTEISLDVEWAHAIAPQANIVLVEANSESTSDVFKAMLTAETATVAGSPVSVVSMSWGYNESSSFMQSNLPTYDSKYLTTPGVTFVAATLDNGSRYGVFWPAISPNVVGVGGTVLTLNSSGGYGSEKGWSYSTGGISKYETQPSYQKGVVTQSSTMRANPDVSYAATNFAVYDTAGGYNGWYAASGTSAGTPQWAALIALVDQEREASGLPSLNSTQTLDALYQLAAQQFSSAAGTYGYFHDITTGSNGAYRAGTGYDLVTGIGTPAANQLIPALASYGTSSWPVTSTP
jgi:subtilase family serine protease